MNPYLILGVSSSASEAEIIRAYRKKCNVLHPDKGGGAEEFQQLSAAYELLRNAKRRKQYDETGFTGDQPADNYALMELFAIVKKVTDQAPAHLDLVAEVTKIIRDGQSKTQEAETELKRQVKIGKARALRWKRKDGPNMIGLMLANEAEKLEEQLAEIKRMRQLGTDMLELLKGYEYEPEGKMDERAARQQRLQRLLYTSTFQP